jgi:RNA polymerase sigma-70 factor, ECF subfamily
MSDSRLELLTKLFSESQRALYGYVRRLVGSRESAEDIVQEAYLRVYEYPERMETPRAFLFSTARNLAADSRRRNRVNKTDTLGDFDRPDVVPESMSLEAELLVDEQSRLLKEAIERLSPQRRAVFTLKVFHGYSYKEIAQRLNLSPKTVENHIALALRDTHAYLRRRYK